MPGCGCNKGNPKQSVSKRLYYQEPKKIESRISQIKTANTSRQTPNQPPTTKPNQPPNQPSLRSYVSNNPINVSNKPVNVSNNPFNVSKNKPINNVQTKYLGKNIHKSSIKQLDTYYSRLKKSEYENLTKKDLSSWDLIHKLAVNATTPKLKDEFEQYIKYLGDKFPCPKCRPHIKERLITHPIKNYYNIFENNKYIGIAKWSWEFHNTVNTRNNKPTMSWNEFKQKYF